MTSTVLTSALALILAAGHATAQELPAETLTIIDTSGDGIVTPDELEAFIITIAAAMDANEDGRIEVSEVAQVLTTEQIAAIDTDGDGILSPEELAVVIRADFAAADLDGSGQLN